MCIIFLEDSKSNCNFIEFIGTERRHDLFFVVAVVVEEISGTENCKT
jgi:hypothetical protein